MKIGRTCILFLLGGLGYVGLELLWRGWSHWSMFLAGGVAFLLLGGLTRVRPRLPLLLRGLVGAGIITMVELAAGLLVNRRHQVWDYGHLPLNYHGQICLLFTLLWIPVALGAMGIYEAARRFLDRRE